VELVKGRTLGELLIQTGLLTDEKLKVANSRRVLTGASLFEVVMADKMLDFSAAADMLGRHYEISTIDLSKAEFEKEAVDLLDYAFASRYKVMPIKLAGFRLLTAMSDPLNQRILDDIFVRTGCRAEPVFARSEDIEYFVGQFYGPEQLRSAASLYASDDKFKQELITGSSGIHAVTATDLIDAALVAAVEARASAIHLEPFEKEVKVRIRVDGNLRDLPSMDISLNTNIMARLKLMGRLDSSERRKPQEGRFSRMINSEEIGFRVSLAPTIHGEKAVVKILAKEAGKEDLGFQPKDLKALSSIFALSPGLVIVSGPSGSGKSATIASFLGDIASGSVVASIEESFDFIIPGAICMEAGGGSQMGALSAIRAAIAQDADVIAVGDVSDKACASLLVKSALKGRMAICCADGLDSLSAISLFLELGVDPVLLSRALRGALSQRLLKKVCPHCAVDSKLSPEHAKLLGLEEGAAVKESPGCQACFGTGGLGRHVAYELFEANDELRGIIARKGAVEEMEKCLKESGFRTIWENASEAVLDGKVSPKDAIEGALL
jgi:type IV pilus assembly protein PilB